MFPHPLLGTWPTTQACAPTGNQTSDSLVCRLSLYPLEPHQLGLEFILIIHLSLYIFGEMSGHVFAHFLLECFWFVLLLSLQSFDEFLLFF